MGRQEQSSLRRRCKNCDLPEDVVEDTCISPSSKETSKHIGLDQVFNTIPTDEKMVNKMADIADLEAD